MPHRVFAIFFLALIASPAAAQQFGAYSNGHGGWGFNYSNPAPTVLVPAPLYSAPVYVAPQAEPGCTLLEFPPGWGPDLSMQAAGRPPCKSRRGHPGVVVVNPGSAVGGAATTTTTTTTVTTTTIEHWRLDKRTGKRWRID